MQKLTRTSFQLVNNPLNKLLLEQSSLPSLSGQLIQLEAANAHQLVVPGVQETSQLSTSRFVSREPPAEPPTRYPEQPSATALRLGTDDLHPTDLGGHRHMSATTGIQIDALDLYESDITGMPSGQSTAPNLEAAVLRRVDSSCLDSPRGLNLHRNGLLQRPDLLFGGCRSVEIDIANLQAEVKSPRSPTEQIQSQG